MTLLSTLLVILMLATAAVLLTGIAGFIGGGTFNERHGNRLMRARVGLQLAAVAVLVLLLIAGGGR